MKNLLLCLLAVGCVVLVVLLVALRQELATKDGLLVALRQELATKDGQVESLKQQVSQLKSKLPPPPEERERQFLALAAWLEKVGADPKTGIGIVMPVKLDRERHTFTASIRRSRFWYEVQIPFTYYRGRWIPQWDKSYSQLTGEGSDKDGLRQSTDPACRHRPLLDDGYDRQSESWVFDWFSKTLREYTRTIE